MGKARMEDGMGEWIEHDGKGMPVDGESYVHVRFRDGSADEPVIPFFEADKAKYWDDDNPLLNNWLWGSCDLDSEIVAYRVVA